MAEGTGLPGVVIVGAMKSATTSLFRYLDEQPETFMAHPKETRFFSDKWEMGLEWYRGLFAGAAPGQLLGEASQNYTSPLFVEDAADRMARVIPDARLIYIVRHPVERTRSHYRHEVQRRRESRDLVTALREPGSVYLRQSSYASCLQPYIDRFPREQLLVIRFEDLVEPPWGAWSAVLRFLSLSERPLPEGEHNVSNDKGQWTRVMAWAKGRGVINSGRVARFPKPIRRLGKAVLTRGGSAHEERLAASRVAIPDELLAPVWEDAARLERWLGTPLWPETGTAVEVEASA